MIIGYYEVYRHRLKNLAVFRIVFLQRDDTKLIRYAYKDAIYCQNIFHVDLEKKDNTKWYPDSTCWFEHDLHKQLFFEIFV